MNFVIVFTTILYITFVSLNAECLQKTLTFGTSSYSQASVTKFHIVNIPTKILDYIYLDIVQSNNDYWSGSALIDYDSKKYKSISWAAEIGINGELTVKFMPVEQPNTNTN